MQDGYERVPMSDNGMNEMMNGRMSGMPMDDDEMDEMMNGRNGMPLYENGMSGARSGSMNRMEMPDEGMELPEDERMDAMQLPDEDMMQQGMGQQAAEPFGGRRPGQPSTPPGGPWTPGQPDFRDDIWANNAVIEEINRSQGIWYVTISYQQIFGRGRRQQQTVRLVITPDTRITDENRRPLRPRELEEGMVVNALFSSAMTRSIPPQARAYRIIVVERPESSVTSEGRIVQVDTRNRFIITMSSNNPASMVRFNVGPDTVIMDLFGRQIALRNLFPGVRVRVEHGMAMTASIPPQTTAYLIQVIQ
ncbi:MAG: hypothetical protein E7256_09715 [Lachnospiraceae bacterium]|nr:hypothetical protein [Lachnospiraceae bacterium]